MRAALRGRLSAGPRRLAIRLALAVAAVDMAAVMVAAPAHLALAAQESEAAAVRLGLTYEPGYVPGLVVAPVAAPAGLEETAAAIAEIIRTDLDYSDRFDILALPDTLDASGPPNYQLWNRLGAVWLVASDLSGTPARPILRVGLHDVVYENMKNVQAFSLPSAGSEGFRMAVHRVSDSVVSWATEGQAGIAATRIVVRRRAGDGTSGLVVIDSDGRNPRRISTPGQNVYSPAFSPDGSHLAYTIQDEAGNFSLLEANLITGSRRTVASGKLLLTPGYTPGGHLAYGEESGGGVRIVLEGGRALSEGRGDALNPSFSPDGSWLAYEADPAAEPQVYVRSVSGGAARRISIYDRRERTNAAGPDWSPSGGRIAYSAVADRRWRIFTVNPDGTDRRMLTRRGDSEDPSWAPDGRHLVFSAQDSRGSAVWIIDTVTGRARMLTSGQPDGLPEWSPPLPPGS